MPRGAWSLKRAISKSTKSLCCSDIGSNNTLTKNVILNIRHTTIHACQYIQILSVNRDFLDVHGCYWNIRASYFTSTSLLTLYINKMKRLNASGYGLCALPSQDRTVAASHEQTYVLLNSSNRYKRNILYSHFVIFIINPQHTRCNSKGNPTSSIQSP